MQAFIRCNLNPSSDDYTQGYHEAFHVVIYIFYGNKSGLNPFTARVLDGVL